MRVPFVTTWSHKLSGFQKSLHYHYKEMINNFPNCKSVFLEPPILSYRCNQNLRNLLPFNRPPPCQTAPTAALVKSQGVNSGGQCTTTNTIYAAECTQHKLIYVGQSSQKLNMRFNGHRSDVNVKPKSCELAQHFHRSHECDIKKDLKVYILQDNVISSRERKEFYEDQ